MSEPAIDTILIIVRCRRNKVEHGESHAYWSEMSSDRIPKDTLVINTGRIRQDQIREDQISFLQPFDYLDLSGADRALIQKFCAIYRSCYPRGMCMTQAGVTHMLTAWDVKNMPRDGQASKNSICLPRRFHQSIYCCRQIVPYPR